jgi:N utilization substance protein A
MKDAERDAVYSSFIDRKGEVINGIVQRVDRGNIIVNLGRPKPSCRSGNRFPGKIIDGVIGSVP